MSIIFPTSTRAAWQFIRRALAVIYRYFITARPPLARAEKFVLKRAADGNYSTEIYTKRLLHMRFKPSNHTLKTYLSKQ